MISWIQEMETIYTRVSRVLAELQSSAYTSSICDTSQNVTTDHIGNFVCGPRYN
jgi:hypothetical protein